MVDWRAPISTVYYENELGEGTYSIPDSKSDGKGRAYRIDLSLKRTYDIENGTLQGFYDSDVAANDELLVKYLSKNRDAVLGDIIATIQKEQNEIIRESPFHNVLVQGVAGSGKTTVAMHRISYIMYNYKERFTSNEFCIVGGSDILIDYITGGLPELDVYDVKHMRMDELLVHLLKREWKKNIKLCRRRQTLHGKARCFSQTSWSIIFRCCAAISSQTAWCAMRTSACSCHRKAMMILLKEIPIIRLTGYW